MRPPKPDSIFEISIKKYVDKEKQNNKNEINVIINEPITLNVGINMIHAPRVINIYIYIYIYMTEKVFIEYIVKYLTWLVYKRF